MRYYKLCIPHYSGMPITKIHRTIREGCRRGDIRGGEYVMYMMVPGTEVLERDNGILCWRII